jgi:hypothetical protein
MRVEKASESPETASEKPSGNGKYVFVGCMFRSYICNALRPQIWMAMATWWFLTTTSIQTPSTVTNHFTMKRTYLCQYSSKNQQRFYGTHKEEGTNLQESLRP